MVRINLINPECLADQHLIAEYNEILMLLGYVRRFPVKSGIPADFCLGKGHVRFFKDKLLYLKRRHEQLSQEMKKRGFAPTKHISLKRFPANLKDDWFPKEKHFDLIKVRLKEKIRSKPGFYRYYGIKQSLAFLIDRIDGVKRTCPRCRA